MMNDSEPPKKPSEDMNANEKVIKEKNIGEVRHDEPVTAKGIARALFMANEPEQRMQVDDSESPTRAKSDN